MMEISAAGLQAIREHEALRLYAYPDPASPLAKATPLTRWGFEPASDLLNGLPLAFQSLSGRPWTIGYGTTTYPDGSTVDPSDVCTEGRADIWLRVTVDRLTRSVLGKVTVPINQPMLDALVSLAYNIGIGAFSSSTLLRRLNAGEYVEAQAEFRKWVRAQGQVLAGLVKRREREAEWFAQGARLALADQPDQLAQFNDLTDTA